jgi:TorA maturation chaperone TorD
MAMQEDVAQAEAETPARPQTGFAGRTMQSDDINALRAQEYALLASLLAGRPSRELLARLARLSGDRSPLGQSHGALAEAARAADPDGLEREFFDLFVGIGRGELLPYASYYLSGFLYERPLALLRRDLETIGVERAEDEVEPEDHVAILCEIMAGLADGRFPADAETQRRFFERHLKPWARRFFADLETAPSARFYRAVGALGRTFLTIEAEAFAME